MENETKQLPEKKFRAGAISVAVWRNLGASRDGQQREFKSFSMERRYKDEQGNWKSTHSLRITDLPKAVLVLNKAYEYVSLANTEYDGNAVEVM